MPTIKLRSVKGSPLTNDEVDSSFNTLNVYKVEQTDSTGSALIPKGTTAQRDASPTTGALRYNTSDGAFEGYSGSAWSALGGIATITVTVSGGKFVIDGSSQDTLSLEPGFTYKLDQSDSTNSSHPLRFSETSDGTHGGGSEYTTGVTTSGTPGSAGAYTQIVVSHATPQELYYYCSSHSGMGGAAAIGNYTIAQMDSASRAAISVTDVSGDGSLAYNSGTGVITYTGPSASEVRAHFSGGTGITYNSSTGEITTTDSDIVHDNLSGFVADEHIDHTSVSVIAGKGLTGGGTIAADRTIDIDSANVRGMFSGSNGITYNSSTGDIRAPQPLDSAANPTFNQLRGPATFVIDPAAIGDATGTVQILGNLQVDGTTTTISSTDVTIDDKTFTLADNAADSSALNGGGIIWGGSSVVDKPSFTYNHSSARFDANRTINATSFIGDVTGNATTATSLATARNFSISGDVTASAVSFDGSSAVTLSAAITSGAIVNDDINASAAIADTKLATISTASKVSNSATTATSNNTNSAIVARDGSGNFSAGTITADFDRSANTTVSAGTYGSGSLVPVLTVDSSGFIDSIGSVSVAGVSGVAWDSSTAIYTISTADGNSYPKKIVPNSSFISHDNTTGFVANEHINHTSVTLTAGNGLTGGGTIAASRSFAVGEGTGITVAADTVSTNDAEIVHDNLSGFVANEHINHTSVTLTAGNGLTGGGDISANRTFAVGPGVGIKVAADTVSIDSSEVVNYALPIRALFSGSAGVNYNSTTGAFDVDEANVVHDNLSGFVANEHINHTSVTLTAGNGLTGGGTIAASRSFAVGPGVGIKVAADTVSIDSSELVNYKLPIVALFSGGTGITLNSTTGAITTTDGDIVHDDLSGFVANEHINHTSVSITAGNGLTGGGDISATRTINVVGGNGITANANDIAIDSSELTSLYGAAIFTDIKNRDGASSGLDADLLDGQHGSYYRINVYNSSGTLLN